MSPADKMEITKKYNSKHKSSLKPVKKKGVVTAEDSLAKANPDRDPEEEPEDKEKEKDDEYEIV